MRICVVVSDFPKVTETFAIANMLHYLEAGHEVSVFHIKPYRHHEILHDEAVVLKDRAFTFSWIGMASLSALLHAAGTRPLKMISVLSRLGSAFWKEPKRLAASLAMLPKAVALGRHAQQAGIDHIHAEFASHPATCAWIANRLYGSNYSFSAHMHDIFVSQNLLAEKARHSRFVRAISDFNVRFLSAIDGFEADKLTVIRCGVAPQEFSVQERRGPEPKQPFDLLFVGSLHTRKGCFELLSALKGCKGNWRLTVIGDGPDRPRIDQLAKTFPKGAVTMMGAKPSSVVYDHMRRAHLLVLPSQPGEGGRTEGIPVVLMEAMAAGCPVISSRLSGIPELIDHGTSGSLIEPGDVQGLTEAIDRVMQDYPEALRMADNARTKVLAEYDIRQNAAQLLARIEASS